MIFSLFIPVIVSVTKSPDCLVLRVILYASKTALRTASSSGALCASGGAEQRVSNARTSRTSQPYRPKRHMQPLLSLFAGCIIQKSKKSLCKD